MNFEVEYYEKENGECPIREFLDSLSPGTELPFVIRNIRLLQKYGYELRRPHADILRDGIYELRVITKRQIRLLYFFYERNKIILTHGIIKKGGPVKDSEIKRAIDYRKDYEARKREEGKRR